MSPSAKFNALLASITVSVMFLAIVTLVPVLNKAGVDYPLLLTLAALITSAGLYRLLSIGVRWVMERNEWVRSLVLGPHYVHGTWIGWFRGHTGELRYMVEHFSQDLDSITISGRSYTADKKVHGYWVSESVTIDARKGQLIFTYAFDVLTQSTSLIGIHTSLFERESPRHAPTKLSGFAHDLNDKIRIAVHSTKVSDTFMPWDHAVSVAERMFKDA